MAGMEAASWPSEWAWLLAPEWASEWIVYWSRTWDFVKVLELAGKFTLLIAAVTWVLQAGDREKARQDAIKAKHYRAWELINSARGSTGDGGRKVALKDLNEDGVALDGVPLAKATLFDLELPKAKLILADLSSADLPGAKLSGAYLSSADLTGTNMPGANLSGAHLPSAKLFNANLSPTVGAKLPGANLSGADLTNADLSDADLTGALLTAANLYRANLEGADLTNADLTVVLGLNLPSGWELFYDDNRRNRARRKAAPAASSVSPRTRHCYAAFRAWFGIDGRAVETSVAAMLNLTRALCAIARPAQALGLCWLSSSNGGHDAASARDRRQ